VREGWQTKRLGDACAYLNRGVSPKYLDDGGICVLGQRCVRNHRVDYGYSRRHDLSAKKVPVERFVQAGDVLVNSTGVGSLGRVAQVRDTPSEPTTVDSHVTIVRPNSEEFFTDFFGYMMMTIEDAITEAGEGCGGQTELGRRTLAEKFIVGYPTSLAEQQRIVAILDEVFEDIATATANAEKNLGYARAIFESHLDLVFTQRGAGWVDAVLGDVCGIARGGSPRPIKDYLTASPGGINWIKIADATASGKYIYETKERIIPDGARRSRMVHEGDFLLSNSMSFGHPYIMRTSGCIHDGWLVLTEYASRLNQDYLYYLLGSSFMYQQFDQLAAGSTVRNLNIELASRVEIPIPPLERQQEIAVLFDAMSLEIERLESIYQRKLVALDALKQSLLHHAFSGQL